VLFTDLREADITSASLIPTGLSDVLEYSRFAIRY
jgi:hypothetical protein